MEMVKVYGWERNDRTPELEARDFPRRALFDGDGKHVPEEHEDVSGQWFLSLAAAKRAAIEEMRHQIANLREEISAVRALRKGDVG